MRLPCAVDGFGAAGLTTHPSPSPPRPPGAKVWLQAAVDAPPLAVPPPATYYYAGTLKGEPASAVLLAVGADGGVSGVAHRSNATFVLGKAGVPRGASAAAAAAAAAAPMASIKANTSKAPAFSCGTHELSGARARMPDITNITSSAAGGGGGAAANRRLQQQQVQPPDFTNPDQTKTVTLAIETDAGVSRKVAAARRCLPVRRGCLPPKPAVCHHLPAEYLALFKGDQARAVEHAALLVGCETREGSGRPMHAHAGLVLHHLLFPGQPPVREARLLLALGSRARASGRMPTCSALSFLPFNRCRRGLQPGDWRGHTNG